jgi:hypothetical protein
MRSKFDAKIERRGKAKKPKPVPGGKALQRLFHFLGQRDPKLNDEVVTALAVPKAARPKFGLTKQAMRMKVGADAKRSRPKARRGVSPEAKKYATAVCKAANAIAKNAPPARTAARATSARAAPAAKPATSTWQFAGPLNIPNGQTYGSNRVDVIGRVACIAVDPGNAAHLLLGAAGGGIWESKTTGTSWAPRSDFLPSLAIGAIVFDPINSQIVYAGSGEGNWYRTLGAGVYKSTDGGTNWTVIATTPFVGAAFYDLVIDPQNTAILYAATTIGFYVSTNSGVNWTLKSNVWCWDISVGVIGANTEILVAFQNGLFVSTANGNGLTAVTLPSPPAMPWDRLAVDRVKATPDCAYVFGAKGAGAHLWRRKLGIWTKITTLPVINTNQAWYDWYVAATPNDVNEVYLGEINGYRGNAAAGWTWTPVVTNGANSIHPDQHCLTFSPTSASTIYAGNDGGIYKSTNKGGIWTALNNGLGITEIEYMAGFPSNLSSHLMAGTQDNGTILHVIGPTWFPIADGDGGDCGINATSLQLYHSFYNATLQRGPLTATGVTWTNLVPPPPPPPMTPPYWLPSLFYPPVEVAESTVAIGANPLIYSLNGDAATSGSFSTLPLPGGITPSAMRARNPISILIGSTAGDMRRVTFIGAAPSITSLTSPRTPGAYISCIAIDPSNPNRYWVTFSQTGGGRVYRSDDSGVSWTDCTTAGLPNIPINSIVVDPANYKRVFVAADRGVYETTNLGASWAVYGTGLPNALAADLLLHAQDRVLTCGMRNRGAWSIPL